MKLSDALGEFFADPLGFVYFSFDWGKGLLKEYAGPDKWQADIMNDLAAGSLTPQQAIQIAVASGHGIGKTALIAWIILWFISTRVNPQIVCTANTKTQLETKTWRELAKWHNLLKYDEHKGMFDWTATKFYFNEMPATWCANAIPWSKEKSEAFAGTHEENVLVLFDEASLIDDVIWEVTEGAMTTPGAMWIAFGNPTRNTGRFRECFGKFRHRWITRQIDSRTAAMTNKTQIDQWIQDYGEDSDFVRVRVKGQFPRASSMQFIPVDLVDAAMSRSYHPIDYDYAPKIIGLDIARFGDDQTVIQKRQGLVAWPAEKFRELDNMTVVGLMAQRIKDFKPDAVFIDQGAGTGVIDRLRQLGYDIIEVPFGSSSSSKKYFNKRCEMWGLMKDWLIQGGSLHPDDDMRNDLIGPEYGFSSSDAIQLERKEDMKKRGLASPDCGDALALTFAHPVHLNRFADKDLVRPETSAKYDPFNHMNAGGR
jgi:hypothetical protein